MIPSYSLARPRYDEAFFESQQDGSVRSAQVVVPIVLSLFPCRSVVDVGCGVGGWLEVFESHGVTDYLGIDGNYILPDMLKIPASHFRPADLQSIGDLGRGFDLACSLEVAEHLPGSSAKSFVAALVKAAPVVLFSAAVPLQGGTNHINEQQQSYWAKLFAEHGYIALDCIRPAIFGDSRVEWWYRQNTLVYCLPGKCPQNFTAVERPYDLDRVDPGMIDLMAAGPQSGRAAAKMLIQSSSVLAMAVLRKIQVRF